MPRVDCTEERRARYVLEVLDIQLKFKDLRERAREREREREFSVLESVSASCTGVPYTAVLLEV